MNRRNFLKAGGALGLSYILGCDGKQDTPAAPQDPVSELGKKYNITLQGEYTPAHLQSLDEALAGVKRVADFTRQNTGLTIARADFDGNPDEMLAEAKRALQTLDKELVVFRETREYLAEWAKRAEDEQFRDLLNNTLLPAFDEVDMEKHRRMFAEKVGATAFTAGRTIQKKNLVEIEDSSRPALYQELVAHELAGHYLCSRSKNYDKLHEAFRALSFAAEKTLRETHKENHEELKRERNRTFVSDYANTMDFHDSLSEALRKYERERGDFVHALSLGLTLMQAHHPDRKDIAALAERYHKEKMDIMDKGLKSLHKGFDNFRRWYGVHHEDIAETAAALVTGALKPMEGVNTFDDCIARVKKNPYDAPCAKAWVLAEFYKTEYK